MTCMEAQALITPFINNKLDIATLEQFIDHVENCKECKEELEVYHALLTAMKQLDEDEEVSADFAKELENKLKESQELILRTKLIHIRKKITFFAVVLMIGLFTSVSVSVVEEVLNVSKETTFNSFVLQNEVIAPYMESTLFDNMQTYPQVKDDLKRIAEEEEQKEEMFMERQNILSQIRRKRQLEAAHTNTDKAKNLDYSYPSTYERDYEEAKAVRKLRLLDEMSKKESKELFEESLKEYSR